MTKSPTNRKENMKRKKQIKVTADDIKAGCRFSVANCPVARGLRRAFRRTVTVDGMQWALHRVSRQLGSRDTGPYRDLPKRVKNWIARFDTGKEVKPFSFTVAY